MTSCGRRSNIDTSCNTRNSPWQQTLKQVPREAVQSPSVEMLRSRLHRPWANWPCLEQGGWNSRLQRSLPASIILQFYDSLPFLTRLGVHLHSNSRPKASTKAEQVFPVRSLVNIYRTYQLSTLHLAKLNSVFCGSPPALCGHEQDREPAFLCTSFPLCIVFRSALSDTRSAILLPRLAGLEP